MNNVSLVLSILLTIAMAAIIAPSVIAMNHGKALRNIALWLAIFVVLGLIYQNFGPESKTPLFGTTIDDANKNNGAAPNAGDGENGEDPTSKGDQGFNPPRE